DTPVPCGADFPLVAGMKPAVSQRFRCFLRTIPVARKNIWPSHHQFFVFAQLHFDTADGRSYPSGLDVTRIVYGADRGRLSQAVNLENRDAKHIEVELGFNVQRRRTANQSL